MTTQLKRTNIYLAPAALRKLRRIARERGVSVAFLVRSAVTDFIQDYRSDLVLRRAVDKARKGSNG